MLPPSTRARAASERRSAHIPVAYAPLPPFAGLLRIENLNLLKSLKKLQLDNNGISKIENLEALTHLEWLGGGACPPRAARAMPSLAPQHTCNARGRPGTLTPNATCPAPADLSFNRIKKIEGLSHLSRLRDLSLFNNEISVAEGLEGLHALQCLSLGSNTLTGIDTVLYFRKLPALEALTLEGNPLCKPVEGSRDNYTSYAHAFLPHLKYLDYRLITAAEKSSARDGGVPAEKLGEVEEKSAAEEKAAAAAADRSALVASLAEQNLEMAVTFPGELFADEPEFQKLLALGMPGLEPLVKALGEALTGPANNLKELAGDKDARIRGEMGASRPRCAHPTRVRTHPPIPHTLSPSMQPCTRRRSWT